MKNTYVDLSKMHVKIIPIYLSTHVNFQFLIPTQRYVGTHPKILPIPASLDLDQAFRRQTELLYWNENKSVLLLMLNIPC